MLETMAKAILTTKVRPTYDDLPEARYHFPKTYLNQIERARGDWIVYYEPRRQDDRDSGREGRQAYFALARIADIQPDLRVADHFYAYVTDYLEFPRPVPFREGKQYYEAALFKEDGSTNRGAFGRSVRQLSDAEFELICQVGLARTFDRSVNLADGLQDEQAAYERPIIQQVVNRPFRDAVFARNVRAAYDSTCALTGIQLINGGGRTEMEAAHIRPVGDGHRGTDSVRNGIALCQTVHWMFDRGLVSLNDDCSLLVAEKYVPEPVLRMLNPDKRAVVPVDPAARPHPLFLRYHREHIFKG
jgi:putative restriction endonuclease